MNAFFCFFFPYWREATQLRGTTALSSGRKLKYPNVGTGAEPIEAEHWSGTWSTSLTVHRSARAHHHPCRRPNGGGRLILAILHNPAFRHQRTHRFLRTLFRNWIKKRGEDLQKKYMALLTELPTSNENLWNKTHVQECKLKYNSLFFFFSSSFRVTNFVQLAFL